MSLAVSGIRRRQRRRQSVVEQRYLNPGKGINVYVSEEFIDDHEASGGSNFAIIESGCISKRNGWTPVGSGLENAPRGLASYYPVGASPMLVTIDGDTLKYLTTTVWTADMSGVVFSASPRICFVEAGGNLYIWNSINSGRKFDGSAVTAPTTTVNAAFGIFYAGVQIVSGVSSQPNRLYISSPTDYGDFTNTNPTGTGAYSVYDTTTHPGATTFAGSDANYLDVNVNDGDKITALSKYGNQLIIFKERSIWSLTFDSSGKPVVQHITSAIGCVSHWSIDSADNDLVFQSRFGFYVLGTQANYQDQLRSNQLSLRIKPFVDAIVPSNLVRSSAIWSNGVYRCAVTSGGGSTNNRVYAYYKTYGGWSIETDINANAFTEFIDSNNIMDLYYADELTATVWKQTTGYLDGSNAIDMEWTSKAYDMGQYDTQKRFVDVTPFFRELSGSVKLTILVDGQPIGDPVIIQGVSFVGGMGRGLLGQALLGGVSEASATSTQAISATKNVPYRIPIGVEGRTVQIKVQNSNPSENFVLLGFGFGLRMYGRNNFPAANVIYP